MNKIDKKLLDILVCPVSKGPLEQIGDELVCQTSKLAYPIKDGITVMPVSYTHLTLPTTPYV